MANLPSIANPQDYTYRADHPWPTWAQWLCGLIWHKDRNTSDGFTHFAFCMRCGYVFGNKWGGGWVIANGDHTTYRTWGDFGPEWTPDLQTALWFFRRDDAERFCKEDEDAWAILTVGQMLRRKT